MKKPTDIVSIALIRADGSIGQQWRAWKLFSRSLPADKPHRVQITLRNGQKVRARWPIAQKRDNHPQRAESRSAGLKTACSHLGPRGYGE